MNESWHVGMTHATSHVTTGRYSNGAGYFIIEMSCAIGVERPVAT